MATSDNAIMSFPGKTTEPTKPNDPIAPAGDDLQPESDRIDPPSELSNAEMGLIPLFGESCEGCKYNRPGQDDHMQPGGCLWEDVASCSR